MSSPLVAVGYIRRSRESEARTVSLEDQQARIESYAAAHGWQLAEVLADDGVSGGRRERLERLDARVRATGAGIVIVYHLDRFARDAAALLDWLERAARRGIELHVVGRGRIETQSASGYLMAGIEGVVAAHYRKVISEKTRDALARLRTTGRRVSRFPAYGYRLAAGGRILPDPREQAIVGEIAALRRAGLSLRRISRALASRGVLARNGRPFTAEVVRTAVRHRTVTDSQVAG
jgi:DNA invertase Pin-like site-specific DNA recombinase